MAIFNRWRACPTFSPAAGGSIVVGSSTLRQEGRGGSRAAGTVTDPVCPDEKRAVGQTRLGRIEPQALQFPRGRPIVGRLNGPFSPLRGTPV